MLKHCIKAGASVSEFWEMTYGEAFMVAKDYYEQKEEEQKNIIRNNHQLASLISAAINYSLSGKPFPQLESFYPDLFPPTEEEIQKKKKLYSEAFKAAAEEYNRKLKNKQQ